MHANGLLGSAKPGHIEPIDRNAVENTDDSIKAGVPILNLVWINCVCQLPMLLLSLFL